MLEDSRGFLASCLSMARSENKKHRILVGSGFRGFIGLGFIVASVSAERALSRSR